MDNLEVELAKAKAQIEKLKQALILANEAFGKPGVVSDKREQARKAMKECLGENQ